MDVSSSTNKEEPSLPGIRIPVISSWATKNPTALRFTKEAIRAVRHMTVDEAQDYLRAKSDALKYIDKEKGREHGMSQFLDDKSYRPGFGPYERKAG